MLILGLHQKMSGLTAEVTNLKMAAHSTTKAKQDIEEELNEVMDTDKSGISKGWGPTFLFRGLS